MNGVYLRALPPGEYADALVAYLREQGSTGRRSACAQAAPLVQEKIGTLGEFPAFAGFLFHDVEPDPALLDGRVLARGGRGRSRTSSRSSRTQIEAALKELCERLELKPRQAFAPIRVAVTGSKVSPGLYESLALLGREESLARLRGGARRRRSGLGGASGSSARWNSSHARRRKLGGRRRKSCSGSRCRAVARALGWALVPHCQGVTERVPARYGRAGERRADRATSARPAAQTGQSSASAPPRTSATPASIGTTGRTSRGARGELRESARWRHRRGAARAGRRRARRATPRRARPRAVPCSSTALAHVGRLLAGDRERARRAPRCASSAPAAGAPARARARPRGAARTGATAARRRTRRGRRVGGCHVVERMQRRAELAADVLQRVLVALRGAAPIARLHVRDLPHAAPSLIGRPRLDSPPPDGSATRTVLVVDDEPSLRLLCRVNLELEGYRVLEAGDARRRRASCSPPSRSTSCCSTSTSARATGSTSLDEIEALELPVRVVMLSGTSEYRAAAARAGRRRARQAVRARGAVDGGRRRWLGRVSRRVSVAAVRAPAEFEERLARYLFERSEEGRAVRVGEKETSEQAAIVERYRDLFTTAQLEALRDAEAARATATSASSLYRLRKTCEAGIVAAELAGREDELENAILAARIAWRGEELPLRTAQAKLAVLPEYRDRDELGALHERRERALQRRPARAARGRRGARGRALRASPTRSRGTRRRRGSRCAELERALDAASRAVGGAYDALRERWFERLLGPEREDVPTSNHTSYLRRLSPLEATYTKERAGRRSAWRRCGGSASTSSATPGIRLDLDDRPQKSPRACVIASDPPNVVHLITRAQGGLHDYQAFLHEAGHALHYAGCDPALPYTFRKLSRDHALTEIYSYIVEAISREPGWHAEHFGLSDEQAAENAEATTFLEALLFRRYTAKLQFELEFWGALRRGRRHARRLLRAADRGDRHPLPGRELPLRHGRRLLLRRLPARLDPLGAAARSTCSPRSARTGGGSPETGERLRELFREGTRPTSEEIAARLGYDPLDTQPLAARSALAARPAARGRS